MTANTAVKSGVTRNSTNDAGVALVVALLLMLALSTLGASLLMVAQTETYASMNYRMMSQARYGAESGVLRAVNYLTQTYQSPGYGGDPLSNYDTTVTPVLYNGAPVRLSANPGEASNYPAAAVQAAFFAAAQGTLNAGQTVTYNVHATLVSMREILEYGATAPRVIQTWRLDGMGSLGGSRPATVAVSAILERQVSSAHSFGVFATQAGCGALSFGGGTVNDSYDSSNMTFQANGMPVTQLSGGKVGTNGNLTLNGNAEVYGTLSTPRTGVGKCKNGAVNALTGGTANVTEGLIQLPQALSYPTPEPPNPLPPTGNVNWNAACNSLGYTAPLCTGGAGDITIDPQGGTFAAADVYINANAIVRLKAGTYNLNSLTVNGGATVIIETGPVFINIAGVGNSEPIDFQGGSIQNPSYDPTLLHIVYGGTGSVTMAGGAAAAGLLYAPNAAVEVTGGADWYGSMVGATVDNNGGTDFHYDRKLVNDFFVAGNYMMSAFTWKKY